jgi:ABC transport system ATP-binding/permease protein
VETLELLETLLIEYTGTVIVVSHDRAFLDNVVTSTLVLDGSGGAEEFVGGWSDLPERVTAPLLVTRIQAPERSDPTPLPATTEPRPATRAGPVTRKLSYKDARELEQLPARIERLEKQREGVAARLSDPESFRGGGAGVQELRQELETLEQELATAYARWEALETRD